MEDDTATEGWRRLRDGRGLLGRLQSAAMKSIVTETAESGRLEKLRSHKPATVDVKMGSARATLLVGSKAENNTVYARGHLEGSSVVTIDSALLDELKKTPDDYRRKDVFEFRSSTSTAWNSRETPRYVAFEKVKSDGKDAAEKWRRVSPNPADADKDKMDSLLNRVSNMRVVFCRLLGKDQASMPLP